MLIVIVMAETYLVLDKKLDTLNWSGSGLGDSGGDTSHCDVVSMLLCCQEKSTIRSKLL